MTNSVAKTYRLPAALYKLILEEVEKNSISEADFVRDALKQYFEHRLEVVRMNAFEKRLINVIEINSQHIAALIQQVIAMAGPSE